MREAIVEYVDIGKRRRRRCSKEEEEEEDNKIFVPVKHFVVLVVLQYFNDWELNIPSLPHLQISNHFKNLTER